MFHSLNKASNEKLVFFLFFDLLFHEKSLPCTTTKHFTCIRVSFIRDIQLLFWFVRRLDNWVRRLFTENSSFLSETFRATCLYRRERGGIAENNELRKQAKLTLTMKAVKLVTSSTIFLSPLYFFRRNDSKQKDSKWVLVIDRVTTFGWKC